MIDVEHGTSSGWNWHQRSQTPTCEECKTWARGYRKERRKNAHVRALDSWYATTRRAALVELAARHPDEMFEIQERIRKDNPPPHHTKET